MLSYTQRGCFYILVLVVENVNSECAPRSEGRVGVGWQGFLGWKPEVELSQPVLKGVHLGGRNRSTYNRFGSRAPD